MHDLFPWAEGFPGLLWQVELRRSRLAVLRDWSHPLLGADTARLIKDIQFRKQAVRREDLPLLAEFQDMMTTRNPAAVSFYLNAEPDKALLLQGWPLPDDPALYCGFLKYAFLPQPYSANGVLGSCQMALTSGGYPVFVLDALSRRVLAGNQAARALFMPRAGAGAALELGAIAPAEMGNHLIRAARKALEEDVWGGTLYFCGADGGTFSSKVRLSPCSSSREDTVVRIALLTAPAPAGGAAPVSGPGSAPLHASGDQALHRELEALAASSPDPLDGLMFSDIQSRRGKVEVYGVGACFEKLEWGAVHTYEGTIAQDIERFGLPSLMVEDTSDSIKSIDWVLFIPHNVRSYFALPFYNAEGLHAVLILASSRPGAFGMDAESRFAGLKAPFEALVARWRAAE